MAAITASAVKALRERTGLPLMDCKKALVESDGDQDGAIEKLKERGLKKLKDRSDRSTEFGGFGLYVGVDKSAGALVELKCESAPVTKNEDFLQLAQDLATQLATGPGAASADELLAQPSPSQKGMSLNDQKNDLFNRIREVFNVGTMVRFEGATGGYIHPGSTVVGVLLQVEGGNDAAVRDVAMHVAAMNPSVLNIDDVAPEVVDQERAALRDAALAEGKPEKIVDKMVEGRLKNFFAESVLNEQVFVKAEDGKQSVGKYAAENGMKIVRFHRAVLGQS